jgi:hypothetical protein
MHFFRHFFTFRIATLLWVGAVSGTLQARTISWDPLGYSVSFPISWASTRPPPVYPSKQAMCEGYLPLIQAPSSNACYEASVGDYCVPKGYPCMSSPTEPNAWMYSDTAIGPSPVCALGNLLALGAPILDTRPQRPRNVKALIGYSYPEAKCGCLRSGKLSADLAPDLSTGWCYDLYALDVRVSRSKYKPSEAKLPIEVTIEVLRSDSTPAANTPVTISVSSADGTPGTITPASGVTDAKGELSASYTFPTFSTKKTDTITVGCESCMFSTAQVDIKMAPTVIGLFNGVWNTETNARKSRDRLEREFGSSFQLFGTNYQGASLTYELFYNQSACGSGGAGCLEDIFETFAQRDRELGGVLSNRWEYFWEMLSGTHTKRTSLTGTLLSWLGGVGSSLLSLIDSVFGALVNKVIALTDHAIKNPPTNADVASQLAKLQTYADDDYTLVLVAHSQGNLFVNKVYDSLMASKPGAIAKVVHVAPASPTLRGKYVLADIDVVINGLRSTGLTSIQPININLPISKSDLSGHTFEGTYLDMARGAYGRVRYLIVDALESL